MTTLALLALKAIKNHLSEPGLDPIARAMFFQQQTTLENWMKGRE